ncbi:MAG: class I SAM-dependent methyltransferase [Planctomycetota bacterium]|nr:MAG: class I SAM-dependent methyltransferase [Planctomycetota bacterium]
MELDRHKLYELCVQSPPELVPQLVAIHGGTPRVLGEDFCGTAAISVEWTRHVDGGRAIAVDRDAESLARIQRCDAIEVVAGDVVGDTDATRHAADVIWAGNFSIGELHTRSDLLAYLGHTRSRLEPGGLFACDLYGGESAFLAGSSDVEHPLPDGSVVVYTWEQCRADPLTGRVRNAMHFEVRRDGVVEQSLRDAFTYDWRLWSVPELRDALVEVGFATIEIYARVPDAVDDAGTVYVQPLDAVDDSFDVIIAARVGR